MILNLIRSNRKTVWLQLLTYFVLIALITLAFSSGFLYRLFSQSFKGEVITLNDEILNQMSMASDEFILKNVNELALNIAMYSNLNPDLKAFFDSSDRNDWGSILGVRRLLDNLLFQNRDIVDSIYVYSSNKGICTSEKMMKYIDGDLEDLPEYLGWINKMSTQNKSLLYLKTRPIPVHRNSKKDIDDIITIVCTYPISSTPQNAKGYVAVNIKEEAINNYLADFNSTALGQLLIIDDSGAIISHSDRAMLYEDLSQEDFVQRTIAQGAPSHFETKFNGTEYLVAHTKSYYNGWHYISMVPTSLLYQKNYFMRQRLFTVSTIALVLILLLSGILSRKVYLPLKALVDKYSVVPKSLELSYINEYQLLDFAFNDMSIRVDDLQATLDKNMSLIQSNILKDLLRNASLDQDEVENTLCELQINFPNKYFAVSTLTIDKDIIDSNSPTYIQSVKYSIIDFIRGLSLEGLMAYPIDMDSLSITVINSLEYDDINIIMHFIEAIEVYCYSSFSFYLTAGIGTIGDNIANLNQSYKDSKIALKYKFLYPDEHIFSFDDMAIEYMNSGTIPNGYLGELDKSIRLGHVEETDAILNNIYSKIYQDMVPYIDVRNLISSITKLFTNFVEDVGIDLDQLVEKDILAQLLKPQSADEYFRAISTLLDVVFDHIESRKLNKNFRLVTLITEYIRNNIYGDLSLNSIADKFNISPQYLSRIFKEEMGDNYIDYITACKIEEAKDLLAASDLTIAEISSKLGYSHATYFSRKFREYLGCTPSEYRRNQTKSTIITSF